MTKEKIAITGGSGFLAKNLVHKIDKNKFDILLLTRSQETKKYLAKKFNNITIEIIDWSSIIEIEEKLKNIDYIIHAGAMVPTRSDSNNFKIIKSSIKNAQNICKAKLSVKKFIFISTLRTCINTKEKNFFDDTSYNFYHLDTAYGKSKYLTEKLFIKNKKKYNLPLIICSPAHIIGPENSEVSKSNEFVFNIFNKKVVFYTDTKYAIVDINDVCNAIILMILKSNINEKYLICNNNPSMLKLINICKNIQKENKIRIYLPLLFINLLSIFFEFLNKKLKIKKIPINRSSYYFAKLNGEFKGEKIKKLGLIYTNLEDTIGSTYNFYSNN